MNQSLVPCLPLTTSQSLVFKQSHFLGTSKYIHNQYLFFGQEARGNSNTDRGKQFFFQLSRLMLEAFLLLYVSLLLLISKAKKKYILPAIHFKYTPSKRETMIQYAFLKEECRAGIGAFGSIKVISRTVQKTLYSKSTDQNQKTTTFLYGSTASKKSEHHNYCSNSYQYIYC